MATGEVSILEHALQAWERYFFVMGSTGRILAGLNQRVPDPQLVSGPAVHHASLRRHLLRANQDGFDILRYVGTPEVERWNAQAIGGMIQLPWALWNWNRYSRRVFRLDDQLQALLMLTSLARVRWPDIRYPFQSFGLELSYPITAEDGGETHFILFWQDPARNQLHFLTLTDTAGAFPVNDIDRNALEKSIRAKNYPRASRSLNRISEEWRRDTRARIARSDNGGGAWLIMNMDVHGGRVAQETIDDFTANTSGSAHNFQYWQPIVHLVLGLCLYLDSLPSNHGLVRPQSTSTPLLPNLASITRPSEICHVLSDMVIPQNIVQHIQQMRGRAFQEMAAHWRKGHWRRRPGQGGIIGAPKTVWVRPSPMNFKRLLAGELPIGNETLVR